MTILVLRDDLLDDLFPETAGGIEQAVADYYAVGPVRPTVTVEYGVIRVEVALDPPRPVGARAQPLRRTVSGSTPQGVPRSRLRPGA